MSFRLNLPQTFAERVSALDEGRHLAGMWVCSGSPVAAEIAAASGMQWVLIDAEHSPIGLETTTSLLRAMNGYPATPVVRVPVNDRVVIKQFLDLGAQNLLVPMVDTEADAEAAVAAIRPGVCAGWGRPWPGPHAGTPWTAIRPGPRSSCP